MTTAQSVLEAYSQAMEQDQTALSAMQEEMDLASESFDRITESQNNAADSASNLGEQTQAVNDIIGNVTSNLDVLIENYNEAYEAAYTSVSGQYAIWDEAAEVVPTSISSINDALATQLSYWQDYNANLDYLSQSFDQFPGLQEVVASFADGSAESINAVAGITQALKDGNYEDVQSMITDWQSLQTETVTTSDNIAEMKTNSLAAMDELVSGVETDIQNLNLSEEATAAGKATLQGYINGMDSLSGALSTKLANIQSKISNVLMGASAVSSVGTTTKGYASGTESAERGFALVGEKGPELVFFNGGEKVLTSEETEALRSGTEITVFDPRFIAALESPSYVGAASAGSGGITLQVSIVVEGNATPETVAMLQDYGDDFADRVLSVVREANIDAKRGDYT